MTWTDHRLGVRIEGHRDKWEPCAIRLAAGPPDERLMTLVHAVEHPDARDRTAGVLAYLVRTRHVPHLIRRTRRSTWPVRHAAQRARAGARQATGALWGSVTHQAPRPSRRPTESCAPSR